MNIPATWAGAPLRMLGAWSGGGTPSKQVAEFWSGDIPWVSPKDMKVPRIQDTEDHITTDAIEKSATALVPRGSVLVVTRSGILRHSLPVAVADRDVTLNQDLKALTVADGLVPEYVVWALRRFDRIILSTCAKSGTTVQNLDTPRLLDFEIPIAPITEQRRIVAAIEEHFSRLDSAEESLLRAKRRLSLLRSAAFMAAINGGWAIKRLDEIAHTTSGGTPSRRRPDYFGGPIPWVKSGELRDGRVRATEETITELGLAESSAKIFERGTLLIALYGATVGKLGILDIAAATNQAVCAIKPHDAEMIPYLWIALRQKRAELVAAGQGGAQPNISQAILRRLRIPVPPPDEQRRIVAEIERQLSIADATAAEIDRALRRSAALRRSILKQAFSGELVPQDPSDEPSSALLERIATAAAPKPSRRNRKIPA